MINLLRKLSVSLGLSWNKSKSPQVKSRDGDAINAQDGSNVHKGDINIFSSPQSAIEQENAWQQVIDCFNDQRANDLIKTMTNPLYKRSLERNVGGWKKSIEKKFEDLKLSSMDPRTDKLIELLNKTRSVIQKYIDSLSERVFLEEWSSLRKEMLDLKESLKKQ